MWLRRLFRRRPSGGEIDAELRDHLERLADDLRRQGVPHDEAMRQARLAFGGEVSLREQCREARTSYLFDRLGRWARDVTRATRRDPLVSVVCTITLGLGIGATTAVATLVDATLLRPLPYPNADRLVELWIGSTTDVAETRPGIDQTLLPELRRALRDVVTHVEAYQYGTVTLTGDGEPQNVSAPGISAGLLDMLGIVPRLGRLLGPEDTPDRRHIVISEGMWLDRFGGDPAVLGKVLMLDDQPHVVVGVMPRHLQFPSQPAALWRALSADPSANRSQAVGMLRDGVSRDMAGARLAAVSGHLRAANQLADDQQIVLADLSARRRAARHRTALLVMLGAVSLVLLIACINVSSLLLARASSRESEFTIRSAVGARRGTLATRLFGEGLVVAFAGGAMGLVIAHLLIRVFLSRLPTELAYMSVASTHESYVLAWALAASALTAVGISLLPIVQTARGPVSGVINGSTPAAGAGRDNMWQSTLVVAQLAVVLLVLAGGGLLLRSFVALTQVDPGFDTTNLLVAEMQLPRHRYPTGESRQNFMRDVAARAGALGGVVNATVAEGAPPTGGSLAMNVRPRVDEAPASGGAIDALPFLTVRTDYFSTLGIDIVEGRAFVAEDSDQSVIVSRALARRYWGSTPAVGRLFQWGDDLGWYTVVGVAEDAKQGGLDDAWGEGMAFYVPYRQNQAWHYFALIVKTRADGGPRKQDIRAVVAALDADLPVLSIETMEERLSTSVARQRFFVLLATGFASIAVLMAAVGIFGNAAYWVTRRRREIALRMAIGASPTSVQQHVLSRSLRLAVIGMALGLIGALGAGRLLDSLLFGIHRYDPWTFFGVVALMGVIVVLAAYLPARRASRLDPWKILQA